MGIIWFYYFWICEVDYIMIVGDEKCTLLILASNILSASGGCIWCDILLTI